MKKLILVILFCLFVVGGIGLIWEYSGGITGNVILDEYSYTKAICEGIFCQDYEIFCLNGELIEMTSIEGAWVFHEDGWEDFRTDEGLC